MTAIVLIMISNFVIADMVHSNITLKSANKNKYTKKLGISTRVGAIVDWKKYWNKLE